MYHSDRHSAVSHKSELSGTEFLVPVAFNPNEERESPSVNLNVADGRPKDYFSHDRSGNSAKKEFNARHGNFGDREEIMQSQERTSPHIAYQEKRRPSVSEDVAKGIRQVSTGSENSTAAVSPSTSSDRIHQQGANTRTHQSEHERERFRLQDVPKGKGSRDFRAESAQIPRERTPSPETESSGDGYSVASPVAKDASNNVSNMAQRGIDQDTSSPRPSQESRTRAADAGKPIPSPRVAEMQYPPKRGDSLDNKLQHNVQKKDVGSSLNQTNAAHDVSESAPSAPNPDPSSMDGGKRSSKSKDSSFFKGLDSEAGAVTPQTRSDYAHGASKSTFASPRSAPAPPENRSRHNRNESISTLQSEPPRVSESGTSPGMLRYSAAGDFTMEEDMARILGNEDPQSQESFLRRVSNSVRHGRSFSDKGSRMSRERKWPRSPTNGSSYGQDVNSPTAISSEHREEVDWYKNELRKERQKTLEKDQKITELETALSASASIKQVNTELREKRSTMVVLDAQKEIVVRELEVLTEHIAAEKKSNAPLDLSKMSNTVLREFAQAIQKLKQSFAPQIEELILQRNDLVEELANLTRQKDKSFHEFETLSLKNAQLADLNNQLVSQIQELYQATTKADNNARAAPNGLGIYSHQKDKSSTSFDARDLRAAHDGSLSTPHTIIHQEEAEPATIVPGPQVVSIRKGGQARKFNWKKGQNVAKGVTKGLKGAFSRDAQLSEGQQYGAIQQGHDGSGALPRSHTHDPRGFGFFGNQKNRPAQWKAPPSNGGSPAMADNPTGKFSIALSFIIFLLGQLSNICSSVVWNGVGDQARVREMRYPRNCEALY